MTSVFPYFLKKRAKIPQNRFFHQNFLKFPRRVRTHPNASRCIRTGPNRPKHARRLQKTSENIEIFAKQFKKIRNEINLSSNGTESAVKASQSKPEQTKASKSKPKQAKKAKASQSKQKQQNQAIASKNKGKHTKASILPQKSSKNRPKSFQNPSQKPFKTLKNRSKIIENRQR